MSNLPSIPWTNRERAEIRRRLIALETGGGGGGATDLGYTAATRLLTSSTGADATLPLVTSPNAGLAPASGGGTTNFLRADGTWAAPGGGGGIAESFETVSKNLPAANATIAYFGGEIDTITYSNGVVKTFSYGVDGLSMVVLSGSTPGGIDLTKTLTYSAGQLSGFTYS